MKKIFLCITFTFLASFSTISLAESFKMKLSNKGSHPGHYSLHENEFSACAKAIIFPQGQTAPSHGSGKTIPVTNRIEDQAICFTYPGRKNCPLSRTDLRRNKDKYFDVSTCSFRTKT